MGRRMLELLARQEEELPNSCRWSSIRAQAADLQGQSFCRAALSLPENMIAAVLHAHGALHLDVPAQVEHASLSSFVASIPQTEWSDELSLLYSELHTVRALLAADEPPISLGGFGSVSPGEDVGQREELLEGMAAAIQELHTSMTDVQPPPVLEDSRAAGLPVHWSAGWPVGWPVGRSAGRSVDRSVSRWVDRSAVRPVGSAGHYQEMAAVMHELQTSTSQNQPEASSSER